MKLSRFSYDLPSDLIAQTPLARRDVSRLLRLDRTTGQIAHHHFFDLPALLRPGDLLVLNNTRVLPVRLIGRKPTGGEVEILLTKRIEQEMYSEVWEALTKPGLKIGQKVEFINENHQLVIECLVDEGYTRRVRTSLAGTELLAALDKLGSLPTPPYIKKFVGDPERYQTVFGHEPGSAAAPTAGLHFTPELLTQLKTTGIETVEITLHVGLGTFLPVKENEIEQHQMHSEWYEVSPAAAKKINTAREAGRRIVAVGTTALRTLESTFEDRPLPSLPQEGSSRDDPPRRGEGRGRSRAGSGETSLFVYPPYRFRAADALITNFHLPESTLLMLVSAFTSWPQTGEKFVDFQTSSIGKAYHEAIQEKYRFFSFGDAMLIE